MELEHTDLSIPRRQYYSDKWKLTRCPECGKTIEEKFCPIYMGINDGEYITKIPLTETGSHFCDTCPVVVFDMRKIEMGVREFLKSDKENIRYAIYGIFDYAAIPEDKIDEVIGTDENPFPLVHFLPPLDFKPPIFTSKPSQNAPCPCGSGKKYKRCCGK